MGALSQSHLLGTHEYNSSASSGVALFNNHKQSSGELLEQADIAMYQPRKPVAIGAGSLVPPVKLLESRMLYVGRPIKSVRALTTE